MNPSNIPTVDEAGPEIYRRFGGKVKAAEPGIEGKNIGQLNMKGIRALMRKCYELQPKGTALILGGAGIGKSQGVVQFAQTIAEKENRQFMKFSNLRKKVKKEEQLEGAQKMSTLSGYEEVINDPSKYYIFLDLRAGELNPEQAQGIPDVEYGKEEGYLKFLPPDWIALITNPAFSGLVFLDELNRGQESVINSLLQFVLDRVAAGIQISEGALIIAAANLGAEGEFTGTTTLDSAVMSRFDVGVLVADIDEWVKYARKIGVSSYIIDFCLSKPDMNFYGKGRAIADHNVPVNPRNLVEASRNLQWVEGQYLNAAEKGMELPEDLSGNIYQDIQNFIMARVGREWANDFVEWLQIVHEFDWADIVARTKSKKFETEFDTSKSWALVNYITTTILARYEKARKTNDEADKKKIIDELYTILTGIDLNQVSSIIKTLAANIRDNPPPGMPTGEQAAKDFAYLMDGVLLKAVADKDPILKKLQGLSKEFKNLKEDATPKKIYEEITLRGHQATPEQLAKLEGTRWGHKLKGTKPSSSEIYKSHTPAFKSYFKEVSSTGNTLNRKELADRVVDKVEDQFGVHYSDTEAPSGDVNRMKGYAHKIISQANASQKDKMYIGRIVDKATDATDLIITLGLV